MESQNITISLSKELIKQVKHLAIEKDSSVSRLLAQQIEHIVKKENAYHAARQRQLHTLKKGYNIGLNGEIHWERSALHER